jgi:hypothetical protein
MGRWSWGQAAISMYMCYMQIISRPAARSYRQKAAILARFKGNNTRRPLFFSACFGMVLVNNISARKKSRREVGGPARATASGSRATHGGAFHPHP